MLSLVIDDLVLPLLHLSSYHVLAELPRTSL